MEGLFLFTAAHTYPSESSRKEKKKFKICKLSLIFLSSSISARKAILPDKVPAKHPSSTPPQRDTTSLTPLIHLYGESSALVQALKHFHRAAWQSGLRFSLPLSSLLFFGPLSPVKSQTQETSRQRMLCGDFITALRTLTWAFMSLTEGYLHQLMILWQAAYYMCFFLRPSSRPCFGSREMQSISVLITKENLVFSRLQESWKHDLIMPGHPLAKKESKLY